MNNKYFKILLYLTIGLISYLSASYNYRLIKENHIDVPGTVINNQKQQAHIVCQVEFHLNGGWLSNLTIVNIKPMMCVWITQYFQPIKLEIMLALKF